MSAWVRAGLGLVFLATGIALLALALRGIAHRRAFMALSERATGEVIGFAERRDRDALSLHPTVRFRTLAGIAITFESQLGSERPRLTVGSGVPVRYRVDRPNEAEIASFLTLWGLPVLASLAGLAFLAIGAGALLGWIPA